MKPLRINLLPRRSSPSPPRRNRHPSADPRGALEQREHPFVAKGARLHWLLPEIGLEVGGGEEGLTEGEGDWRRLVEGEGRVLGLVEYGEMRGVEIVGNLLSQRRQLDLGRCERREDARAKSSATSGPEQRAGSASAASNRARGAASPSPNAGQERAARPLPLRLARA